MPRDLTDLEARVELPVKKPEVFSLEGLIAWLETQDQWTTYPFTDSRDCVLARWAASHGYSRTVGGNSYTYGKWIFWRVDLSRFKDIAVGSPHTYATALQRARQRQAGIGAMLGGR